MADGYDMETVAGRLRWAIDRQPPQERQRGLRLFQRQIEARSKEAGNFEGVALSSIQKYVSGDVEPSLTFLREAAALLGVRAEWLILGNGPPTQDDLVQLATTVTEYLPGLRHAYPRFNEAYRSLVWNSLDEVIPGWWDLPDAGRGAILAGFGAYVTLPSTLAEFGDLGRDEAIPGMARRYAAYLAAPLEALRLETDRLGAVEHTLIAAALRSIVEVVSWTTREEEDDE